MHYVQVFLSTASCHCKFYCFVLRHPYVLPVSLFLNGEMGISELLLVLTLEPIPPLPFLPLSSFSLPSSPLPFPLIPSLSSSSFPFPSLSSHSLSSLSLSLQVSWASSTKSMLQWNLLNVNAIRISGIFIVLCQSEVRSYHLWIGSTNAVNSPQIFLVLPVKWVLL